MTILNRVFDYALRIKSLLDNYKKYRYYAIAIIGVLIVGIGFFVYLTGGIKYVFSHSMYLPIIISALLFGARGGIDGVLHRLEH